MRIAQNFIQKGFDRFDLGRSCLIRRRSTDRELLGDKGSPVGRPSQADRTAWEGRPTQEWLCHGPPLASLLKPGQQTCQVALRCQVP